MAVVFDPHRAASRAMVKRMEHDSKDRCMVVRIIDSNGKVKYLNSDGQNLEHEDAKVITVRLVEPKHALIERI